MSEHYPASAVKSSVYLIERFDRRYVGDVLERRHALDAAQLLSLSAGSKYTMAGAQALNDVAGLCRAKAATRIALFRWTIFNILIGNNDAHLKNISLYAGREGYSLAPHYDLVSTVSWMRPELVAQGPTWPELALTHAVGEATHFTDLRRQHVFEFGTELRLPKVTVERELDKLLGGIREAADKVLAEYEARTDVPPHMRAGQLHMLACIRNLPIPEMYRQLS